MAYSGINAEKARDLDQILPVKDLAWNIISNFLTVNRTAVLTPYIHDITCYFWYYANKKGKEQGNISVLLT